NNDEVDYNSDEVDNNSEDVHSPKDKLLLALFLHYKYNNDSDNDNDSNSENISESTKLKFLKFILNYGGNVNIQNEMGNTILMQLCSKKGYTKSVKSLLKHNTVNLDIKNSN